jgi:hypothetical protein
MSCSSVGSSSPLSSIVVPPVTSSSSDAEIIPKDIWEKCPDRPSFVGSFFQIITTSFFEEFRVDLKTRTALSLTCKPLRILSLERPEFKLEAVTQGLFRAALGMARTIRDNPLRFKAISGVSLEVAEKDPKKACEIAELILTVCNVPRSDDEVVLERFLDRNKVFCETLSAIVPRLAANNDTHLMHNFFKIFSVQYQMVVIARTARELSKQCFNAPNCWDSEERKNILRTANEPDEVQRRIEVLTVTSAKRAIRYARAIQDRHLPDAYGDLCRWRVFTDVAMNLLTSQRGFDAALTATLLSEDPITQSELFCKIILGSQDKDLPLIEQYAAQLQDHGARDIVLKCLAEKATHTDPTNAKRIARQIRDGETHQKAIVKIATVMLRNRFEDACNLFKTLGAIDGWIALEFILAVSIHDLQTALAFARQMTDPMKLSLLLVKCGQRIARVDISRALAIHAMPELRRDFPTDRADGCQDILMSHIIEEIAKTDPDFAESYLPQIVGGSDYVRHAKWLIDVQRITLAKRIMKIDIRKAETIVEGIKGVQDRNMAFGLIAEELARSNIAEALRVVRKMSDIKMKKKVLLKITSEIAKRDPTLVRYLVLANSTDSDAAFGAMARELAPIDIRKALIVANYITSLPVLAATLAAIASSITATNLPTPMGFTLGYEHLLPHRPYPPVSEFYHQPIDFPHIPSAML